MSIPSVDLRDFLSADPERKAKFVQDIGKAYEDIGFVALKGHFLSDELAQRQYASQRQFFALPSEIKTKYKVPNGAGQRGYTSVGTEHAQGRSVGDLKEFWHFGQFLTDEERKSCDYFPNVLVEELPDFNTNGQEIFEQLEKTAVYVMRALALFLDLDEHFFDAIVTRGNSILRSIHYPPITEEPKDAVRAGAHTDINMITLLMGAQGRGLQVKRNDGVWVEATAAEDELVINVGDMLSRMTNNRLKSTVHQVVNPDPSEWGTARYSMPFFCHAVPNADLSVLPSCIDEDHPKLFDDITAGDFLMQRLIEIGLIKPEDVKAAKEVVKF